MRDCLGRGLREIADLDQRDWVGIDLIAGAAQEQRRSCREGNGSSSDTLSSARDMG